MRYSITFLVLLGVALWGILPAVSEEPVRFFQLTYEVRLESIPTEAREMKLWIPLSQSDRYQEIRRRVIEAPYPYRITQDPEYGNDILFLDLRHPLPASLKLQIQYEAKVRQERPALERGSFEIPSQVKRQMALHLTSNRRMVVNDQILDLAEAVTQGFKTPAQKAHAIYRYVIERMRYEKETPGWGHGDTLRACDVGAGNCTDFHSLFISLARGVGIPARFRIGTPVPDAPQGEIPGYHCWAEFYLPGAGWVPVDTSEAWKDHKRIDYFFGTHDPNRLALTTGRDIQLVPHSANGPVNIFFYPYVEIDGKLFDGFKTRFRFRDLAEKGGKTDV